MALVINTNVASLNAQRNLDASQSAASTSLERLSSGLRINSARDDAAGLAIANRFTSQINGLNQAARNAADGISLAQTAEGALQEVTNNLQRIRELAVQASNATNSSADRSALQAEVDQLVSEIDRDANTSNFNGVKILDGSFTSKTFQVGATEGETVSVSSIIDSNANALGENALTLGGSKLGVQTAGVVVSGVTGNDLALTVTDANGNTVGTAGTTVAIGANDEASTIAATINGLDSALGLEATATNSVVLGSLSAALGATSFTLEGTAFSATITDAQDLTVVKDAVNAQSGTTGITASFADSTDKGELTLTASDGRDIAIASWDTATAAHTAKFGTLTLDESATDTSAVAVGSVSVTSTKGAMAFAETSTSEVVTGGSQASTLDSVDNVDLATSAATASASLSVLDSAIAQVSAGRADLGAIQNRFESVISSLQVASENAEASRSRIQDADFASETANLTKSQILTQAGISVLAQANAQPQQVLALLQ